MDRVYYLELAKARLERAKELLEDARELFVRESYKSANNRAFISGPVSPWPGECDPIKQEENTTG